jgi:Tol biopolymer transport system component
LGFINSDGSSPVIISTGFIKAIQPIWSTDHNRVYYRYVYKNIPPDYDVTNGEEGEISYIENGKYFENCKDSAAFEAVYPYSNTEVLITNSSSKLVVFNLDQCKETDVLLDIHKNENDLNILYNAYLSLDRKYIVYSEYNQSGNPYDQIKRMNILTGETIALGEGINPIVSPDSQSIAYVKPDGIYLMTINGLDQHKLIAYQSDMYPDYEEISPMPYWSADGKWLLYHKCIRGKVCHNTEDFSIFKANVADGTEVKLYDGGLYPYWN